MGITNLTMNCLRKGDWLKKSHSSKEELESWNLISCGACSKHNTLSRICKLSKYKILMKI